MKRARTVFVFPNWQIAVCDADGRQVIELQGPDTEARRAAILAEADEHTRFFGWDEHKPGSVGVIIDLIDGHTHRQAFEPKKLSPEAEAIKERGRDRVLYRVLREESERVPRKCPMPHHCPVCQSHPQWDKTAYVLNPDTGQPTGMTRLACYNGHTWDIPTNDYAPTTL